MNLVLGLLIGVVLAVLREPVAWPILVASAAAGALLRQAWWSAVCAALAFLAIYAVAAQGAGNVDLAPGARLGAALLALLAFLFGKLARHVIRRPA